MRPLYIFDIDGTLADNTHRAHLLKREPGMPPNWDEWYKFAHLDSPRPAVIKILESLLVLGDIFNDQIGELHRPEIAPEIWFFTGRPEEYRELTTRWLIRHTELIRGELSSGQLNMRPTGDYRPDYEIKQEMVDRMLACDRERLVAVFDDRDQVVDMWRRNGIDCFQVAPGKF